MRLFITFLITLVSIPASLMAETKASARFNPPRIALGDRSQYIVEVVETSTRNQPKTERITALPIPDMHGLTLKNGRTSNNQQAKIINGAAEYTATQSLIIDASAPSVGNYTIPAYTLKYKGERIQVPAATLQVLQRSADAGPTRDELIFLKAELPEKLYVGQQIPLELKLYLEESVQLSGLNEFNRNADGFTLSELPDDYREDVEMVNGRRYRTLTWPLTLTPIQTGEQQLSFQFALTARLPDQNDASNNRRRSPFSGSLFNDFFSRAERVNVYTDDMSINVLPLPEKGQPESFSGAIGDFAIEVGTDSEKAVQGEPLMLSLMIKGSGNFERITGPAFPQSPDWRDYDPKSKFEASDTLGLSGNKRFDYVFIPQRAGNLKLPETRFSYFDPEKEEYVELTAPPIPVKIEAAKINSIPQPIPPTANAPQSDLKLSKPLTSEESLLTLDYQPKPPRSVGYAILKSPSFISLNALAGLALVGSALVLGRRKRNREDPTYPTRSAAKEALKASRQAYLKALQQSDAEAFYKHGQEAIRHAATIQTGRSRQSADSAEIESLLPDQAADDCRAFFAAANAHRFGGHSQEDLKNSQQQVERILQAL